MEEEIHQLRSWWSEEVLARVANTTQMVWRIRRQRVLHFNVNTEHLNNKTTNCRLYNCQMIICMYNVTIIYLDDILWTPLMLRKKNKSVNGFRSLNKLYQTSHSGPPRCKRENKLWSVVCPYSDLFLFLTLQMRLYFSKVQNRADLEDC